ncbi:hypothetical protein AAG570_009071 [Ranatra chinensis]|uniref:Uncharacterized protein n=1 Tax=Ranatra chinensis TaxID=642074 RepID=A0ABD0YSN7_9HEMI
MASKRRNMFHKNKTQETTENGRCNLPPFCDWVWRLRFARRLISPKTRKFSPPLSTLRTVPLRTAVLSHAKRLAEYESYFDPSILPTCVGLLCSARVVCRGTGGRLSLDRNLRPANRLILFCGRVSTGCNLQRLDIEVEEIGGSILQTLPTRLSEAPQADHHANDSSQAWRIYWMG